VSSHSPDLNHKNNINNLKSILKNSELDRRNNKVSVSPNPYKDSAFVYER